MTRHQITTGNASSDGCRLAYTIEGRPTGAAVLFSNALGTAVDMWTEQVDALASRFRIVRYDTRGHGRSDVPPGEYTIDQLGRDALAVLDAAGIESAHVCGLSLGGVTAMWLGIHAPARVRSLVLACTASRIGNADSWNSRIQQVRTSGIPSIAEGMMARWFTDEFRRKRSARVHELREALARTPQDGYVGCCAALRDADLGTALAAITAPALVISGVADPATPPADGRALHGRIRGAAFVLLDTAHLANVEEPATFNGALVQFLTQGSPVSNEVL